MNNLFQRIPFLRISIALAFGIFLASRIYVSPQISVLISLILLGVLYFLHKSYRYSYEFITGWIISLLFLFIGAAIYSFYNTIPKFYPSDKYVGIILETPEEKTNSYKSLINAKPVLNNDSSVNEYEKILVYFEKTEKLKPLTPGSTIIFFSEPRVIQNNGNPYEFDMKNFMNRKKIYRQLYLKECYWEPTEIKTSSILINAELLREKLLKIYRQQNIKEEETEILSALTLGYKRGLDQETKRVFSAAGAMHILAVSGLHVGIIFGIFLWIFGFLRKQKIGKILFVAGALILLWGYAFITGLSPSVLRSATMFSLICIADNINRRTNIYNSLAVAAFVLLIINPNNLFEVGFQLSFAAVTGIVFLQPKLAKFWPVKTRILKYFWILLTVSISAQIATFPITSYYFNQFPTYFWLTNLIIIPVAFILIVLGILLLVSSPFPVISSLLSTITQWVINNTYSFLKFVETLPSSTLDISINILELFFLVIAFILLSVFITNYKISTLKTAIISLLIMAIIGLGVKIKRMNNNEMIVYNYPSNPTIHLINGKNNYVISESPIKEDDFIFRLINTVKKKKHLSETEFHLINEKHENTALLIHNNVIGFRGKIITLKTTNNPLPDNITPDFMIVRNFKQFDQFDNKEIQTQIIATSNYDDYDKNKQLFSLKDEGAFKARW